MSTPVRSLEELRPSGVVPASSAGSSHPDASGESSRHLGPTVICSLGGLLLGSMIGLTLGAVLGLILGLYRGDPSKALDGALLGGGVFALLGLGYGYAQGCRDRQE